MGCFSCFDSKEEGDQLNPKISSSHEQPMQPPGIEKLSSGEFCLFQLVYVFFRSFVGFLSSYLRLLC